MSEIVKIGQKSQSESHSRTPVLMVGSVISQKPVGVMMARIPSRCSERRECNRVHSGIARKGITAKVQTLGLNLIKFAT